MIKKVSKKDKQKMLNVVQREMKLASRVASLAKYGLLDECKKNNRMHN